MFICVQYYIPRVSLLSSASYAHLCMYFVYFCSSVSTLFLFAHQPIFHLFLQFVSRFFMFVNLYFLLFINLYYTSVFSITIFRLLTFTDQSAGGEQFPRFHRRAMCRYHKNNHWENSVTPVTVTLGCLRLTRRRRQHQQQLRPAASNGSGSGSDMRQPRRRLWLARHATTPTAMSDNSHCLLLLSLSLRSSQSLYSRAEQHSHTIYKILKTNKNCIQNRISR